MKTTLILLAAIAQTAIAGTTIIDGKTAGAFTNGSFEVSTVTRSNAVTQLYSQDKTMEGWWVFSGVLPMATLLQGTNAEVDVPPVDGKYQLVFNYGDNPAPANAIGQYFDTIPGADYVVSFQLGRCGTGHGNVGLGMYVATAWQEVLGQIAASPPAHGYGNPVTMRFTATRTYAFIVMFDESEVTTNVDLLLDNVQIYPAPPPQLLQPTISVADVSICWPSVSGDVYQVQYQETISGSWTNLGSTITGNGGQMCAQDGVTGHARRFYRVQKVQ